MKKITVVFLSLIFSLFSTLTFGSKITKRAAEGKLRAAEVLYLRIDNNARTQAPIEVLALEKALNNARKEFKDGEWRYAFQEADKVSAYVSLVEAILAFKKAEKDLEDFRRNQ